MNFYHAVTSIAASLPRTVFLARPPPPPLPLPLQLPPPLPLPLPLSLPPPPPLLLLPPTSVVKYHTHYCHHKMNEREKKKFIVTGK